MMSPWYIHLPIFVAPCLRVQCILRRRIPWNCKFFNAYSYIQAMNLHMHTLGTFNNHTASILYIFLAFRAIVPTVAPHSADYYACHPGIVNALMLTYMHAYRQWPYIYIHRVGSITIQCIAWTGSWSWYPCYGCEENGKYLALSSNRPTSLAFWANVLTITPPRLHDVTILPMRLCGSLPERSVVTTTISIWSPVDHTYE